MKIRKREGWDPRSQALPLFFRRTNAPTPTAASTTMTITIMSIRSMPGVGGGGGGLALWTFTGGVDRGDEVGVLHAVLEASVLIVRHVPVDGSRSARTSRSRSCGRCCTSRWPLHRCGRVPLQEPRPRPALGVHIGRARQGAGSSTTSLEKRTAALGVDRPYLVKQVPLRLQVQVHERGD